eukprot:2394291-Amphidinium_carterae.1
MEADTRTPKVGKKRTKQAAEKAAKGKAAAELAAKELTKCLRCDCKGHNSGLLPAKLRRTQAGEPPLSRGVRKCMRLEPRP